MDVHDTYQNPLVDRYCSREAASLFSPRSRYGTWRELWIALAEAEHQLGLDISDGQLSALRAAADDIDFERAAHHEKRLRHDVMAHVHTFAEACPEAGGILHLGATSCFITDNTDLILIKRGLEMVGRRLRQAIGNLRAFALEQADRPTLGFTHFQPAQFTTVGKRACLWLQDLMMDHAELDHVLASLRFRGVKGTTGTQDSFMKLFEGDEDRVEELDRLVTEKMGFDKRFTITGQTYPRKVDSHVVNCLASMAQSAHKFSNDMRLLCHLREIEEPFEKNQIGSSAMAYKRNPMRSERIGSLSRFVISMTQNTSYTEATQWLERTLDDSANRRLSLPLAFMAVDAILILVSNVTDGLVVRDGVIRRRLEEHLPFIASEELLMKAVAAGGDRQALHEVIRTHAMAAADAMKEDGGSNDFLTRLDGDASFSLDSGAVDELMDPARFIGRAPSQVRRYVEEEVDTLLAQHPDDGAADTDLRV